MDHQLVQIEIKEPHSKASTLNGITSFPVLSSSQFILFINDINTWIPGRGIKNWRQQTTLSSYCHSSSLLLPWSWDIGVYNTYACCQLPPWNISIVFQIFMCFPNHDWIKFEEVVLNLLKSCFLDWHAQTICQESIPGHLPPIVGRVCPKVDASWGGHTNYCRYGF